MSRRLEVIVEEPSAEEAIKCLLPKIVQARAETKVINMRNKSRLFQNLPARLRAYRKRIDNGEDLRILVLLDRDQDDCQALKKRLEDIARSATLATKTRPQSDGRFIVVNRIVVEELESWFIGDTAALRKAFPSLPGKFPGNFSNPNNGGTWERRHRFLKTNRSYRSSYPKIEAARKIAPHIDPVRNLSPSFQQFLLGVQALL
ncbi:MAG: DUF4276 family protein [Thiohalocapsa sp. PB-PSB1]|jgi:hypothetical protein|nr:MAG: hypothetical protein N838_01335 [Thiohalocapsa sp. PB-PSB1]QQO56572.1 MAG: DUF4276 family protein [Thiohalocapsa sp. PB-PSB1]